ncbi:MAG: hypothetical protein AMJ79_10750 [Phycisphaerae bacterium SM23_30]|nr:MAG: hypothetical protein AMJ79_10750 [Phycisphaerae bacterium SM23_30]
MNQDKDYQALTDDQIAKLAGQGCTAEDWILVRVAEGFDPSRLKNTHFTGSVSIGRLDKKVSLFGGIEREAGISNATIHNCRIGNNVYINNVENYIANYHIKDDVVIDHVALLAVEGESSFGNGTEIAVINEVGGREIPIYDQLTSQIAYILALYRHDQKLIDRLKKMIVKYVASVTSTMGLIATGVRIINCGTFKNIKVGPYAVLDGASRLDNGTINSCPEDPSFVGTNVIAHDFILCSGAKVSDNSIISRCFVGQGTELAKQYSAENSAFFANCGGYHGEACSVFAGPYTVTHHKSTLLIAGLYSFLNAGSGSNQSNHMYKLGPVHQGIVERGSKTTSDSYMLWPAKVGAFTLVMGRHYSNSDTSDLPFSYLIESQDESLLVPGVNLRSVGTVRDSQKWPKRDHRQDPHKLDLITFNLLTPYTVQKMINGQKLLQQLKETSGLTCQNYYYNGVKIKRSSLENGINFYQMGIDRYLGNTMVNRLRQSNFSDMQDLHTFFAVETEVGRGRWLDLAGMITAEEAINVLLAEISRGLTDSLDQVHVRLREIYEQFQIYEWAWAAHILEQDYNKPIAQFTASDVIAVIQRWISAVEKLDNIRCSDARKEFGVTARIGFGVDGTGAERDADFRAIRGSAQDNSFIAELQQRLTQKKDTAAELIEKLQKLV